MWGGKGGTNNGRLNTWRRSIKRGILGRGRGGGGITHSEPLKTPHSGFSGVFFPVQFSATGEYVSL